MIILYNVLYVLLFIFSLIAGMSFILLIIFATSGGSEGCGTLLAIMIISGLLATGAGYWMTTVEEMNTSVEVDIVQMEITDRSITSIILRNGSIQHNCCITVDDAYIIMIDENVYVKLDIGDIVTVEITTKTRFGVIQDPIIVLKE